MRSKTKGVLWGSGNNQTPHGVAQQLGEEEVGEVKKKKKRKSL